MSSRKSRHPRFDSIPRANPTKRKRKKSKRKAPRKMTAKQLKYFGKRKAHRKAKRSVRRNPIRTREGRVLRVEGRGKSKRASSKLLLKRKKEIKQHKRRTRRVGRLTYQSAEYILAHGKRGHKVGSSRSGAGGSGGRDHDILNWLSYAFGGG